MKRKFLILITMTLLAGSAYSQEPPSDRLAVAFSDPARPGLLKASLMNGGMTIKAYDGKEVIIEARIRPEKPSERERSGKKNNRAAPA